MITNQQEIKATGKDSMKITATFGAMCVAMLLVMTSFAVMVAMPANAASPASTTPIVAASPAPVDLGTAGDFAVLAKTGISATGTTHITGDIGISPAAASYITGFGLIMDSSNVFSTSSLVTGNIYAADYTPPTPSKMTTAVSDMETAYTDAAGRTLPDYTELYAGDVTGQTLTAGLYKWGTGVLISAGGVTIFGAPSDVWIFQIAQTLIVASGAIVTLDGGAQASNIFWQVTGQTTLGTSSQFNGIILDKTAIVIQTGATLNGRALAQTAVTLDANVVTAPTAPSSVPVSIVDPIARYWTNTDPTTINVTAYNMQGGVRDLTLSSRFSTDNITWGDWADFTTITSSIVITLPRSLPSPVIVNPPHQLPPPVGINPPNTPPTIQSNFQDSIAALCQINFTFESGQGYYEFEANGTDQMGNVEERIGIAESQCWFGTTAPSSNANQISPYWYVAQPLTITATVCAPLSNIFNVTLFYAMSPDNVTWGAWSSYQTIPPTMGINPPNPVPSPMSNPPTNGINPPPQPSIPTTMYQFSFTFTDGSGYYKFYTIATDMAGNIEAAPATADVRYGYDNVLPRSAANNIGAYWRNTSPITITATASDARSGVASVNLYYRFGAVNGTFGAWTPVSADTTSPYSWSYAFADGQGYYEFYTIATDLAGNIEAAPAAADLRSACDITMPISSGNVDGAYWRNTSPITITASATDALSGVASVSLYHRYSATNGTFGPWMSAGADTTSPYTWSYAFASGQGYYEFRTIVTDNTGNVEAAPAAADVGYGYDNVAPTTAVDVAGTYWYNTAVTMTATAGDSTSGLGSVELFYRYSAVNDTFGSWMSAGVDMTAPWSWSYAFASGHGNYEFRTIAIDKAGNVEASPIAADVMYGYDGVMPTSSATVVGSYWRNAAMTIIAAADDAMSGINSVELFYRYRAVNGSFGSWTGAGVDMTVPFSWSFAFASGQGYYEFYTVATDNTGNVEAAPAVADARYGYDNLAPMSRVDFINPHAAFANPTTIIATAGDATSGLVSVQLWYRYSIIDGTYGAWTSAGIDTAASWSWGFNFPEGQGYYQFYTLAHDAAGNNEFAPGSPDAICMYDSVNPSVVSSSPADGNANADIAAGVYAIQFSEPMNNIGQPISNLPNVVWAWSADGLWLNGTYDTLAKGTAYYVNLAGAGLNDLAGKGLLGDGTLNFMTIPAPTVGAVIGRVVDGNGNPINGAIVSVYGTSISDVTDANGDYTLMNVPAGAQKMNISMDGYQSQAVDVSATADATSTNSDIVLHPNASLTTDWSGLLWVLLAVIVLLILTAMLISRHKRTQKTG
jgi:hypothetical protein